VIRFYRDNGRAALRGARVAFVRFGRGHAFATLVGVPASIPDLAAKGVNGCVRITGEHGANEAFFQRVTQRELLAELGEVFDVVVSELRSAHYQCELEFIAALIEWGCGPLPTLGEINAYDRGLADGERAAEQRIRDARAEANRSADARVAGSVAELHELRATVERQRRELGARRIDTAPLERAERQRAADVEIVEGLRNRWASDVSSLSSEREIERARGRVDAAYLIATELREHEVVR